MVTGALYTYHKKMDAFMGTPYIVLAPSSLMTPNDIQLYHTRPTKFFEYKFVHMKEFNDYEQYFPYTHIDTFEIISQ